MSEYHKIQTLWFRDPGTNHKTLLDGVWAKPEFEYLADTGWLFTEKVDGMNIRVIWDGESVRFAGKTDRAQIPAPLLDNLTTTFTLEKLTKLKGPVILYGEGYGPKIQNGGRYRSSPGFILFDVFAGNTWLERETVLEISMTLDILSTPIVGIGKPADAVTMCREGFYSRIAEDDTLMAEGVVLRPFLELRNRHGHRIISKLKVKDFR